MIAAGEPLAPQRKWRAIALATLALVPAFWALLAGLVAVASDDGGGPPAGVAIVAGLLLLPLVFAVLASASDHPAPVAAVKRASLLALVAGIPVAALAMDPVTGIVAGVGAGGIVALRADDGHDARLRAAAVVLATVYTLVLVQAGATVAALAAPLLPLTGIGVADHLAERRHRSVSEQEAPYRGLEGGG